jgi:transcriptional regulator with XRE-family HTH domain
MHNYDQVINTLAAARQSQGVSLRQLAERTDCARATLAENLRGRHRMDALTLLQAAHALGYDLALVPREEA